MLLFDDSRSGGHGDRHSGSCELLLADLGLPNILVLHDQNTI